MYKKSALDFSPRAFFKTFLGCHENVIINEITSIRTNEIIKRFPFRLVVGATYDATFAVLPFINLKVLAIMRSHKRRKNTPRGSKVVRRH